MFLPLLSKCKPHNAAFSSRVLVLCVLFVISTVFHPFLVVRIGLSIPTLASTPTESIAWIDFLLSPLPVLISLLRLALLVLLPG